MLARERQQQILGLLDEHGTVRTADLAEEFQVTDETIRRDLEILSKGNHLTRIHGGATGLTDALSSNHSPNDAPSGSNERRPSPWPPSI